MNAKRTGIYTVGIFNGVFVCRGCGKGGKNVLSEENVHAVLEAVSAFRSTMGSLFGDYTLNEIMALLTMEKAEKENKKLTMSELAAMLKISKPAVSQIADRLEKRGCIQRYMTEGDRRVVCAKISENLRNSCGSDAAAVDRFFALMGKEDIAQLKRIMDKSVLVLEKMKKEKEQGEENA